MLALVIVSMALAAIIVAAALARRKSEEGLRKDGITGTVLYADADGQAKTLVSHRYGLVGKPDYVVEKDGALIPVEKKTRDCLNGKPFPSEVLQLAAYCLILEDLSGRQIKLGRLQYNNRTIDVPFDRALRDSLEQVLSEIRQCGERNDVQRNHESITKCAGCDYTLHCADSLSRARLRSA